MAALCATDQRKEVMNFSKTYYDAGQVVMVNTESSPKEITGEEALRSGDYKVAVEKELPPHVRTGKFPRILHRGTRYHHSCYESLEQGKVDACLQDLAGQEDSMNIKLFSKERYKTGKLLLEPAVV